METLKRQSAMLTRHVSTKYVRNLYHSIQWDTRLIGIKGARGVGKTTLMLQRIALEFPDASKALYASLDNIWFASHTLIDLAENASTAGVTHLFLDEVHRLPGWERQIKNIYDFFPTISIVFSGSSLLEIDHSIADLSRRCLMYALPGLSFREYLTFEGMEHPALPLCDILYRHQELAPYIAGETDILKQFKKYLRHGYYPFYTTDNEQSYLIRVNNIISAVIDYDIPAVENIEYATLLKTKQLLSVMVAQAPSPLNATALATTMSVSKNQVIKLLSLLERARILRLLYYRTEQNPKSLTKPQKVLIDNPSILYALGNADIGKVRESFLAAMLAEGHKLGYPKMRDIMADNRYLFEVGGAGKGFSQIRDVPDSFIAADDMEFGVGNKIPLWLFGFLY